MAPVSSQHAHSTVQCLGGGGGGGGWDYYTFSAKVKIFLWSTPPNWASTFKYSSSRACTYRKFSLSISLNVTIHEQIGDNVLEPLLQLWSHVTLGAREFNLGAIIEVGVVYLQTRNTSKNSVFVHYIGPICSWTVTNKYSLHVQAVSCKYLQSGVEQSAKQWIFHLLHNLSSRLLCIMLYRRTVCSWNSCSNMYMYT